MGQLAACQAAESSLAWEQGGATLQKRWHCNGSTGRCYTSDSAAASSYGQHAWVLLLHFPASCGNVPFTSLCPASLLLCPS